MTDTPAQPDPELLDAALTRFGPCSEDELATALQWPRIRLLRAADALREKLSHSGARRLICDGDQLWLHVDEEVFSPYACSQLQHARTIGTPLSVVQARRLVDLLHQTLFGNTRVRHLRRDADDPLGLSTMFDDGLATPALAQEIEVPVRGRAALHPDVLYALRLRDTPGDGDD